MADSNGVVEAQNVQPTVKKLTEDEMLRIENLALKVQNTFLQEQRLQQDLVKCNEMRKGYQKALDDMKTSLSVKYGVDIMAPTTKWGPDGTLIDTSKGT